MAWALTGTALAVPPCRNLEVYFYFVIDRNLFGAWEKIYQSTNPKGFWDEHWLALPLLVAHVRLVFFFFPSQRNMPALRFKTCLKTCRLLSEATNCKLGAECWCFWSCSVNWSLHLYGCTNQKGPESGAWRRKMFNSEVYIVMIIDVLL